MTRLNLHYFGHISNVEKGERKDNDQQQGRWTQIWQRCITPLEDLKNYSNLETDLEKLFIWLLRTDTNFMAHSQSVNLNDNFLNKAPTFFTILKLQN